MANLSVWLAAMCKPLVARVLIALGFQVITLTGMDVTIDAIKTLMYSYIGGIPAAGLQLALLGGFGTALGIILGAIATRLALWQIQQGTRILGVSS